MNKQMGWIVACVMLFAAPVFGALKYAFHEELQAENPVKSNNMTAKAVLDGERARIDILAGNRYTPGTYMIRDGQSLLVVVIPEKKQYLEIQLGDNQEYAQRITIANPKVTFTELTDGEVIAGYPTRHCRLQASYDMTIQMGTVSLKQKVETTIDKWSTTAFDSAISQYEDVANTKTGNADIDKMLEVEITKFKGLPLREKTVVITTPLQRVQGSKLNMPSSRQRVTQMEVTSIQEVPADPSLFAIPAGYKKSDEADAPSASSAHYLTMQPDGQ